MSEHLGWLAFLPVFVVVGALVWQKAKINRDRRLRRELLRQLQKARGERRP